MLRLDSVLRLRLVWMVAAAIWLSTWSSSALASAETREDKTLSPYFVVDGGDAGAASFPLESTSVSVSVVGVIAEVLVKQAYKNTGSRPINAEYVFPASTRAAVHGMSMLVRGQLIEAKIKEREQAQKAFEAAKRQGKGASLLEQQRPNVFTMRLANLMPGDRIEVTLRYSELLVPSSGVYELVYPTVVGPRYSNSSHSAASPKDKFVTSPYTVAGTPPRASFELSGTLSSPIPVQSMTSPSHRLEHSADNPQLRRFRLAESEKHGESRDFILRYGLSGGAIQSGVSLVQTGNEGYFLLQVEPPQRVPDSVIVPREYVFIVDVSGSMHGFPLTTTKQLLRDLVGSLRERDTFNVLLFAGASELLSDRSLPANRDNITRALRFIDAQQGGGGTELLPALERALRLTSSTGLSRSFIVVTDGYIAQDKDALELVRKRLSDANVFSFGIGSSVNRFLIEGIAKAGAGEPFVVTEPSEAPAAAARFRDYVRAPVLTDIAVRFEGFDAYDIEPAAVPDVLAERPVVIQGKYRGTPSGVISIEGAGARGPFAQRFELAHVSSRPEHAALSQLWARARVARLSDFGFGEPSPAAKAEIIALGLQHQLLTEFTSFVAVTRNVVNTTGSAQDTKQPLPLPAGVSNHAVGPTPDGADEPELLGLAMLVLVLALGAAWRERRGLPA